MVGKPRDFRIILFPFIFLFSQYRKLSFERFPKFYRKVPKIIWGSFAVFGIFSFGFMLGFLANDGTESMAYKDLEEVNEDYLNLISGYEELSTLYNYQGQNIGVIMDLNLYTTNPEEIMQALASTSEYKDKILVQQGRILEQRKNAGLLNE